MPVLVFSHSYNIDGIIFDSLVFPCENMLDFEEFPSVFKCTRGFARHDSIEVITGGINILEACLLS